MITIAVGLGELVDKTTILAIKMEKINDPAKLAHIEREYQLLAGSLAATGITPGHEHFQALKTINLKLWEIEDGIRRKEARKEFDEVFIQLARQVYITNDQRSALKRAINLEFGSDLVEEKEYAAYDRA